MLFLSLSMQDFAAVNLALQKALLKAFTSIPPVRGLLKFFSKRVLKFYQFAFLKFHLTDGLKGLRARL